MSSKDYSLKEMLTELRIDMREHNERQIRIEEMLAKTYEQAMKTNGRVTKNEDRLLAIETEQSRFKTVFTTVMTIAGIIWTGAEFIFK